MSDSFSTGSADARENAKAALAKRRKAALERAAEKAVQEELAAERERDLPRLVVTGGVDRAAVAKRLFAPDEEQEKRDDAWRKAIEYDPTKRRRGR